MKPLDQHGIIENTNRQKTNLSQLLDALQPDLLFRILNMPLDSIILPPESESQGLKKLYIAYGEKSDEKSSMQLECEIGLEIQGGLETVTVTVTLDVREALC